MSDQDANARRSALNAVGSRLPELLATSSVGVLPVSESQWQKSMDDAQLQLRIAEYRDRRREVVNAKEASGASIGKRLRPVAIAFIESARNLASILQLLAALRPDPRVTHLAARTHDS